MASILVRRDQFNITPQGITHKPTDASFSPYIGDPRNGSTRLGQLENAAPAGDSYDPDQVKLMMKQLWAEYVESNGACSSNSGKAQLQKRELNRKLIDQHRPV